jgi:hypothetical protein
VQLDLLPRLMVLNVRHSRGQIYVLSVNIHARQRADLRVSRSGPRVLAGA